MFKEETMQPKISIIIPIYNVEKYLPDTFKSIFTQTIGFEQLEVILVNDGSTDECRDLITSWSYRFTNVKAIHLDLPSGASGKPRNIGISYATGKYILFADPDDLLLPDSCKELYHTAEQYNSDIIMGTFETFTSTGLYRHDIYINDLTILKPKINIEKNHILIKAPFNLMAKLFKTEFIKSNNLSFLEGVAAQDSAFSTETFMLANHITFIPTVIFQYRIRESSHNPSITQQRTQKYFTDFSIVRKEIISIYEKYNKVNYFDIRYISDLNWLLNQLSMTDNLETDQLTQIIEIIYWFVLLSKSVPLDSLSTIKKHLVHAILDKDYDRIAEFIHKQHQIIKQDFKTKFK